jgi:hypothetical protein
MRRTWLRGRENVRKRYLFHVAGHNLGILMRHLIGAGTPKEAVANGLVLLFVVHKEELLAILLFTVPNIVGRGDFGLLILVITTNPNDHDGYIINGLLTKRTSWWTGVCRCLVFRLARVKRDAWLGGPPLVAALIAAEVSVDALADRPENYVREHSGSLAQVGWELPQRRRRRQRSWLYGRSTSCAPGATAARPTLRCACQPEPTAIPGRARSGANEVGRCRTSLTPYSAPTSWTRCRRRIRHIRWSDERAPCRGVSRLLAPGLQRSVRS